MAGEFSGSAHSLFRGLGAGGRIAGYLIEEQIGTGGMAVVFRARDELLGRLAAVKVIAPSLADDEEFRARFLRESRAAAAVDSPYIVPVYGAGEADGLLYIATRFVAGGDLAGVLRRAGGRLAPGRAAGLVDQVATALDAAHAAGLVHRDVKPQNILVETVPERAEHVYLSDFGLSKGTASTGLTASGEFLGTPDYCAPEQVRSAAVDGRADQYALGCVAFALLTGTVPFHREETLGTLFAHVQDPVPPATGLRPELPAAIDGIFFQALAKSPEDRYGRCGEFATALRDALVPDHPATIVAGQPRPAGKGVASVSGVQSLPERPLAGSMQSPPESPAASPAQDPSQAQHADDGHRTAHAADGEQAQSAASARGPAVTGDGAGYADTITNGSEGRGVGTPGRDRGRGSDRGKALTIWAAASTATVLVAGVAAAAGFHVLTPRHGTVSPPPSHLAASSGASSQTSPSQAPSPPAVSKTASHPAATVAASGGVIIPRVLAGGGYGFDQPVAIASDGTHVWVANGGDSVTDLDASDGSLVRLLKGAAGYGFAHPDAIASDGTHVWVVSPFGNEAVMELKASDGSLIRTVSGASYGFNEPYAIALDGTHVWVANAQGNSVTEINASDGSLVRIMNGASYGFSFPTGIASSGTHVWVANPQDSSVTELDASDGSLVRILKGASYGFDQPVAIASGGTHVWVANAGNSVTELDASDGSLIRTVSGASYGFNDPMAIAFDGAHVWVANASGNSVTEVNASDGSLINTMSGASYGFDEPVAITSDGAHVWVANAQGNSVTELTAG